MRVHQILDMPKDFKDSSILLQRYAGKISFWLESNFLI